MKIETATENLWEKVKSNMDVQAVGHDKKKILIKVKKWISKPDFPKTYQGYKVGLVMPKRPLKSETVKKGNEEIHQHTITVDKDKFDKALKETIEEHSKNVKNPEYYGVQVQFDPEDASKRFINTGDIPETELIPFRNFMKTKGTMFGDQVVLSDWITYNVLRPTGD